MRTISQLLLSGLLNACWQIVLVFACASLCSWLLRSTAARYRHGLWVAALLLSLGLPLWTSAPLSDAVVRIWPDPEIATQTIPEVPVRITEVAPFTATTADTPDNPFVMVNAKLAWTLLIVYLAIVIFSAARLLAAWSRTRNIIRSAEPIDSIERLELIIQNCKDATGVKSVTVRSSSSIPVPITVGFRHPVIIVPSKLLSDADTELLTSGIGHELIHVRRHDYILNLIYELIYLPLSFHPAAALIRRRISQTRELCCDELVADKLQNARVYARSLVQLAAWAPPIGRFAKSTTLGIADADNLEARVMSLLGNPKLNVRRKKLLLLAASLLLALPVVTAASFAVQFDIDRTPQEPVVEDKRAKPIVRPVPEYPEDAREQKIEGTVKMLVTIDSEGSVRDVRVTKPVFPSLDDSAVATVRKWQFEPFYVDGKAVSRRIQTEVNFNLNSWEQDKRKEDREREQREMVEKLKREGSEQDSDLVDRRQLEIEAKKKAQAELARHARITMDQAIQIATSKYPGAVMEGSLMAERWEGMGVLAKGSDVLYHFRILPTGDDDLIMHVWVSATDGHIAKTEKEQREEPKEEPKEESSSVSRRTPIKGGILNTRAISLPRPEYPEMARAAGAEGTVVVDVVIDETGNVVEATAVSGHPLLRSAAVNASRQARFAPTRLQGRPVRVRGSITYNFVKQ